MDVLRNDLGLTGVRTGCRMGECGACTVLMDGRSVPSCQLGIASADGAEVVTPEGLGSPDDPHPVQRAFLDEQAAQCGYCINGIMMEAVAALRSDPDATDEAIRAALGESICRCGTHVRVLRAIRRAAKPRDDTRRCDVDIVRAPGHPTSDAMDGAAALPPTVAHAPTVGAWLRLEDDGRVTVLTGKVELGQGIRTAMAQIVAANLGVPLDVVSVCSTTTGEAPDERYTSGSQSITEGGTALAMAAVALRRLLLERAAGLLGVTVDDLDWGPDAVIRGAGDHAVTLADLRRHGHVTGPITPDDRPDWTAPPLGDPVPRDDLRPKLTGAPAYVHDVAPAGLLHARALLPPTPGARAHDVPVALVASMPGVREVVRDGRVVIVIADREEQAVRAVARLQRAVDWEITDDHLDTDPVDLFRALPSQHTAVRRDAGTDDALDRGHTLRASYVRPYQAHAAIAPSCAVAHRDDERLRIWTHSQGVYPLRRELAALLGFDEDLIQVTHGDGPGCYGHNLADDAAAFAAIAALAVPDTPVRFQFTVSDEFRWEPYGSAMICDLAATLGDGGQIDAWRARVRTDVHGTRPNGDGDRLMAAWLRDAGTPRPSRRPGSGGRRNAVPLYAIPLVDVATDHVTGPLRVSALRSLGAFHNVFATESFVDELAEASGCDPLEFRLRHLDDERAQAVLRVAAERAGWQPHVGPSGRGVGLAVARYKGSQAYVAMVVDLDVDTTTADIAVHRITMACDAGTIINADGLANQLEGGALQGLSRTLHEAVTYDMTGVDTVDWTCYPTLRFAHVPAVDVVLVDRSGSQPLGAGEASTPVVPAAVANAIDDAVGIRMRDLPITPDGIRRRLMDMDDAEAARVRVS